MKKLAQFLLTEFLASLLLLVAIILGVLGNATAATIFFGLSTITLLIAVRHFFVHTENENNTSSNPN